MDNMPIVSVDSGFNVSYDFSNGCHNVYVALGGQVRRVSFPTAKLAGDFVASLDYYYNIKENL